MRFFNYIRLALEFLTKNIKQLIMLTIILATGTILVCSAFLLYDNTQYSQKHTNEILKYKNAGSGYLIFRNEDTKEDVYAEIKNKNHNIHFGHLGIENANISFLNDIYLKQKMAMKSDNPYSDGMEYVAISPEVFELFNLELSEGQIDISSCKDDEMQIYVGSDIAINPWDDYKTHAMNIRDDFGNQIKDENNKAISEDFRYKVCGKLKKGSQIMIPDIIHTSDYISETTLDLDKLVVIVTNKPLFFTKSFFYYSDNDDMNINISPKHESDISFGTISTVFYIMNERNKDVLKFIKQLSAILLLSVIVIQASSQIANIIINANEYGIYYANGFNKNNIIGIMMIEAFFRFILATTLAIIVGVIIMKLLFYNETEYVYVIKLLKDGVMIKSLLVSLVICFIAEIIPAIVVSKIELVRLTKAEE